jgi:hypothetical protein
VTADIFIFNGITKLDLPPDRVLEQAVGKLQGVLVIGFDHEGEFYGASSYADGGNAIWLLEVCKKRILESQ